MYDTVFHVGDSALQFTADLIRGPENDRAKSYYARQMASQNRKVQQLPLDKLQRDVFASMLKRKPSETQMQYWKRRKELLAHPKKHQLVGQEMIRKKAQMKKQAKGTQVSAAKLAESFRKQSASPSHSSGNIQRGQKM